MHGSASGQSWWARVAQEKFQEKPHKYLKLVCGFICLLILASNIWSMMHWSERRGVYDDIGYLRQAHLFERFGLAGFDTDIAHDDDQFFKTAAADIRHIAWSDPDAPAPFVHTLMPSGKRVLQYPPGTGFALALFPTGHQTIGLYVSATVMIFLMALLAIGRACTTHRVLLSTAFGCAAIYFMINPAKSSYSVAPTMVICALTGYLTASLFTRSDQRERLIHCLLIGLLIGVSVNFRIPNALLAAGYGLVLLASFLRERTIATFAAGLIFAGGFVLGTVPTLIANAINAGSPFATTYSAQDTLPPDLSFSITPQYVADLQGLIIVLAIAWTGWTFFSGTRSAAKRVTQTQGDPVRGDPVRIAQVRVALVTGLNLFVNVAFFLSHPIFTPYYLVPIAMLSLWNLLFASLIPDRSSNLMLATP